MASSDILKNFQFLLQHDFLFVDRILLSALSDQLSLECKGRYKSKYTIIIITINILKVNLNEMRFNYAVQFFRLAFF